jgi:hypothetical protein
MVGSSILPVAFYKNQLYFLFGKENPMEDSAKGFSDFGGGNETGETLYETAIREGGEELTGFLGYGKELENLIHKYGKVYKINHNSQYHIHVFLMDYDEKLPLYYNNNHRFLWERMNKNMLNESKLFEKIEIAWFNAKMMKTRKNEFRPFYREIVEHILKEVPAIEKTFMETHKNTKKKYMKRTTMKSREI